METRAYPIACTSLYCGKGPDACTSCPNFPALRAFKAWCEDTQAVRRDPIWSPTAYTATRRREDPS